MEEEEELMVRNEVRSLEAGREGGRGRRERMREARQKDFNGVISCRQIGELHTPPN